MDVYYTYGRDTSHERLENDVVDDFAYPFDALLAPQPNPVGYDFFSWALDAVRDPSGNIVCRATLPGPSFDARAAGCVPLDLFGSGHVSPAALAYVYRTLHQDTVDTLQVAAGSIRGDLYEGWGAGPIGAAAGIEYRDDTINVTHDIADQPWYFNYFLSYGKDYAGELATTEGFVEVNAPLVKDVPLIDNFVVDGAFRETSSDETDRVANRETSHNFGTWKVSVDWDLNPWIRLRGTRSRDVRSPSFYELYAQTVASGGIFGTVTNPWAAPPFNLNAATVTAGGNPSGLTPEKADTWTAGIVFTGHDALERFHASADWYQIVIHGAISELSAQGVVNACFSQGRFCNLITGVPNGTGGFSLIQTVDNFNFNIGSYTTRGIDFETEYTLPLSDVSSKLPGSLNFRAIASYLYNMIIDPGSGLPVYDYAGQSGPTAAFGNFNTSPNWQANAFLTYANGPFSTTLQFRYVGPGKYLVIEPNSNLPAIAPGDAGYSSTLPNSINDNHVDSALYVNLSAQYDITQSLQVFGVIDNLFDKAPPIAPGGNGYSTNPVYFDTLGTVWKIGLRFKY